MPLGDRRGEWGGEEREMVWIQVQVGMHFKLVVDMVVGDIGEFVYHAANQHS